MSKLDKLALFVAGMNLAEVKLARAPHPSHCNRTAWKALYWVPTARSSEQAFSGPVLLELDVDLVWESSDPLAAVFTNHVWSVIVYGLCTALHC